MAKKPDKRRGGAVRRKPDAALPVAGSSLALPLAAALLAAVCLVAYWNSFRAQFLLDSQTVILSDPRLRSVEWQSIWDIFTRQYWWPSLESRLFRPLTTLSYWFNYSVLGNGENPFGYHAVNLLAHWVNAVLAFSLVRAVTRRPWVALGAAAAFAVHPLTVEAVTNTVGRADLLAGMSVVGGLLLYLRFLRSAGRRAAACLAGLGACYLAGVFCKESAVVLPGIMLLHDVAFPAERAWSRVAAARRWLARTWPAYLCVLPGLAVLAWARWALFHDSPLFGEFGSDNPIAIASAWTGGMTAVKVAGYYLALVAWPAKLSCDYSYNAITLFGGSLASGQDLHAWVALAVMFGLLAGAVVAWRRDRAVFFFMGFSAAAFLPTANLLFPIGTIMAERLMYLPLVGMTAAASLTFVALGRRVLDALPGGARRGLDIAWKLAAVAVVAALVARTVARNDDWASGQRLWSSSAQAAPDSIKVIRGLALTTMASDPSGGRVDESIGIALRGLRITEQAPLPLPHMPAALFEDIGGYYHAKGMQLLARGEAGPAREAFGQTVAMLTRAEQIDREINRLGRERLLRLGLRPEDIRDHGTASIYRNLGAAYLSLGEPHQAVETLSYMRHVQPGSFDALYVLATAQSAAAESERARGNLQQASDLLEQAAVNLIEAVLLNPKYKASLQTLEAVYNLLAAPPGAILVSGGKRSLNMEHPVVQRHFAQACVQLVRQLAEGGKTDDAERWRQRMVSEFGVPPEAFVVPRPAQPSEQ
jgi:tetratricopeptide (TPR) repeat protein